MAHRNTPFGGARFVAAQIGICIATGALIAFAPPANGQILLLPLTAQGARILPELAVSHGNRLLARGPIAGSLVIQGESRHFVSRFLLHGVVPIAARNAGCGSAA